MVVLGIDGCPGGWVAAHVDGQHVTWHAGAFAALLELPATAVAVDIPIGLPHGATRRAADEDHPVVGHQEVRSRGAPAAWGRAASPWRP